MLAHPVPPLPLAGLSSCKSEPLYLEWLSNLDVSPPFGVWHTQVTVTLGDVPISGSPFSVKVCTLCLRGHAPFVWLMLPLPHSSSCMLKCSLGWQAYSPMVLSAGLKYVST